MDLVYYQTIKEIADIVGINEVTVKQRMLNARKQLAELSEPRIYALALKTHPSCTASTPNLDKGPGAHCRQS